MILIESSIFYTNLNYKMFQMILEKEYLDNANNIFETIIK